LKEMDKGVDTLDSFLQEWRRCRGATCEGESTPVPTTPTPTPEPTATATPTAKPMPSILPPCGEKPVMDGLKSGFIWKPKSDGAWRGAVVVLPSWAVDGCSVNGKKMRDKGKIEDRPVHILDGVEGASLPKNTVVKCGCYTWKIPDPSKRHD
jgi:hypothetical protein